MKTIKNTIVSTKIQNMHKLFEQPEKVLFFDIETTGFSPKSACIYLIGCAFYENAVWCYRQFFAETPSQEKEILKAFTDFALPFSQFVHFNGLAFDAPFLAARCKKHALPAFAPENQLDIYKSISPFKNMLHLPGCRQKQLEEFIGIEREDVFNGGQLIELYRACCESKDERLLKVLLLHNSDDLAGMLMLYSVMAVPMLFEQAAFSPEDARLQDCAGPDGGSRRELLIRLSLKAPLPVPIACHTSPSSPDRCYFSGKNTAALLSIPVLTGELKFFYPDYKNYSYLPAEDQAIHKSVAVYVDKTQRIPCTAATCYTRRSGSFLPCYGKPPEGTPLFYREYKAKDAWFLFNEDFLTDQEKLRGYVKDILQQLKKCAH